MASSASDRANLQTALEYFGTSSREFNRATWSPSTPAGSTIDYATLAKTPTPETSTAINRNLSAVRVATAFTRPDGTQAIVGEPLLKRRYLLARINELTNTADPNIQRDFGLQWDGINFRWKYVGATGSAVQSSIKTLAQVAAENPGREPNFFEILKAVILSGSVGLGTNGATFVAAENKYWDTTGGLSADCQIMQIGANIIDSWDADNIPSFINFAGNELAGVENLPYLNKLVLCPSLPPVSSTNQTADCWLAPSLWNPHQNGSSAPTTGPGSRVRIALTGTPTYKVVFTVLPTSYQTNPIVTSPTPSIDVAANGFMAPSPPQETGASAPLAMTGAVSSVGAPEKYYGFHFVFPSPPTRDQVNEDNIDSVSPNFGTTPGGNIELQVQLPDNTYKTYQKWNIAATGAVLSSQGAKKNGDWTNTNKLVDPEFVALDPRTLRFGVWGTDASSQGTGIAKKDASYGAEDSLDLGAPANRIEQITWSRPQGASFTVSALPANLSLYATNGTASNHYVDLDGVQRRGDWATDVNGTTTKATIMYGSTKTAPAGNYFDRPQIFNSAFQSVAELGQVFRDQPWKTLNFTIANSADAGLLDAFTLQDVPLTAGRTSLNTRQSPVLAAMISQGGLRIDGSSIITSAQATNVANAIVTATTANPLVSKGDLVARIAADASFTGLLNKEARECVCAR